MFGFVQALFDGVLFGATYALIGIGFTLVFGVMRKINMAYAASSIGGAYLGLIALSLTPQVPAIVVFALAVLAGGALGCFVYVTCFHFIPLSNPRATLMSTIGMTLLIEEVIVHATNGAPRN